MGDKGKEGSKGQGQEAGGREHGAGEGSREQRAEAEARGEGQRQGQSGRDPDRGRGKARAVARIAQQAMERLRWGVVNVQLHFRAKGNPPMSGGGRQIEK